MKKTKLTAVRLDLVLRSELDRIALAEGIDLSDVVRRALREFVTRKTKAA